MIIANSFELYCDHVMDLLSRGITYYMICLMALYRGHDALKDAISTLNAAGYRIEATDTPLSPSPALFRLGKEFGRLLARMGFLKLILAINIFESISIKSLSN